MHSIISKQFRFYKTIERNLESINIFYSPTQILLQTLDEKQHQISIETRTRNLDMIEKIKL